MKTQCKITTLLLVLLFIFTCSAVKSQITWPEAQLLPTFPASAETQDLIYLNGNITTEELYLFASLKGLVNMTQPRIFSYDGDAFAEGPYTWLNSLGIKYVEHKAIPAWNILDKYISEVEGLIVYDPDQIHTVNLATTLAKDYKALIAAPSMLNKLTSPPYNLEIKLDLRGKYTSKLEIYQDLFDTYWPDLDQRMLIGLSPDDHKASLREYAVAMGAAVIWLEPQGSNSAFYNSRYPENKLINDFLSSMPVGSNYLGWWPNEENGVKNVSIHGKTTIASDFSSNLPFHSGMPRTIKPKPMPAKPELQNKIYVAFILSDGDNLQYIEHLMRKLWNNSDRGSVPMGWTISSAMVDAMPGALNYYHTSATENDNLISGPSGYGYTYPTNWPSADNYSELNQFAIKSEEYNVHAGLRVITIWNTITGGINATTGNIFAANAPTLLGLTAQNTGRPLSIYQSSLPAMPLSCNYCTDEQAMKDHIATASSGWNGITPRFVIIQAQPWNNVTPTSFKNVANSLNTNNYVVVRPDHIFQLIREANNITVNPGGIEGEGTGLTGIYYSGKNFETEVDVKVDTSIDFNWGMTAPLEELTVGDYSVKWVGQVQPRYTGEYTFYLTCNSDSRLFINDEVVINKRTSPRTQEAVIPLNAGEKYNIVAEYPVGGRSSIYKIEWASPFQSREVIPQSQLYADEYTGGNSSIKDVDVFSELKVYTTNGVLHVERNNNEKANITIYDTCGKALSSQDTKETSLQLDVNNLSKGIYLISVRTSNYSKVIKHIVN